MPHGQVYNDIEPACSPHTILKLWYPAVQTLVPTLSKVLGELKTFDHVHNVLTCHEWQSPCPPFVPLFAQMVAHTASHGLV